MSSRHARAGRERSQTFDTQREAKAWLAEAEVAIGSGTWTDRRLGQQRVEAWARQWMATTQVRDKTLEGYRSLLDTHVLPPLGGWPVAGLDRATIRQWAAGLAAGGLSASRVRQAAGVLRGVLDLAVDAGAIAQNPATRLRLPAAGRAEMLFLDEHQVADLAATVGGSDGLAVTFAAYTGLRAGELWALRVGSVDLLGRRVAVRSSFSVVNGHRTETPTKTGRERAVPLPRFLVDLLDEHLVGHTSEFLFPAPGGGPVQHNNFYGRVFKPAVVECASVPDGLRFHDYADLRVMPTSVWDPLRGAAFGLLMSA